MTLRDLFVSRVRPTAAQIAARARGPAAKEIAWEGWLAAERGWVAVDQERARTHFEDWWRER
jgi:hypothetical protein